jgi:uncharacterized protein YeaO (DUF488 family)
MVKLKRVYERATSKDGERILVERLWPRGLARQQAKVDVWMKEVAPSTELRKWFAHDPAKWKEFQRRYREELKGKKDLLDLLKQKAGRGTVTLVFAARDADRNSAVVLKEVLSE